MKYNEFIVGILESRENIYFLYSERHHIIPRCLGGSDDEENLVYLTMKEHFIAHRLLWEENPENEKLFQAYWRMCNGKIRIATPEEYEVARKVFISSQLGENNPACRQEVRDKMSLSKRFNYKGASNPFYGKHHSEDSRSKMKETHSNQRWIHKGSKETTVCSTEELCKMLSEGWELGRLPKSLSGSNNPFYGKSHKEESMTSMVNTRRSRGSYGGTGFQKICQSCGLITKTGSTKRICPSCNNKALIKYGHN